MTQSRYASRNLQNEGERQVSFGGGRGNSQRWKETSSFTVRLDLKAEEKLRISLNRPGDG